jgi:hypothetical protein
MGWTTLAKPNSETSGIAGNAGFTILNTTKALVTGVILTPNIRIKRYYDNLKILSHRFLLARVSS